MEKLKLSKEQIRIIKKKLIIEIIDLVKDYNFIKNKELGMFYKKIKVGDYKIYYKFDSDAFSNSTELYKLKYKRKIIFKVGVQRIYYKNLTNVFFDKFNTENIFLTTEFIEEFKNLVKEEEIKQTVLLESQLEMIQAYQGLK